MSRYFGFDCYAYPGKKLMDDWWPKTPLWFVGFYLAPAPSRRSPYPGATSWMPEPKEVASGEAPYVGPRKDLISIGWAPVPIYYGRQQTKPSWSVEKNPAALVSEGRGQPQEKGLFDATGAHSSGEEPPTVPGKPDEPDKPDKPRSPKSAKQLATDAQFPPGTVIFLDVEEWVGTESEPPPRLGDAMLDYIRGWINGIVTGTLYKPGVYCHPRAVAQIMKHVPGIDIRFWVWEDRIFVAKEDRPIKAKRTEDCKVPAGELLPSQSAATVSDLSDPATYAKVVDVWQYVRDCPENAVSFNTVSNISYKLEEKYRFGSTPSAPGLWWFNIDLNVAKSRNPAQDSGVKTSFIFWVFLPVLFVRWTRWLLRESMRRIFGWPPREDPPEFPKPSGPVVYRRAALRATVIVVLGLAAIGAAVAFRDRRQ